MIGAGIGFVGDQFFTDNYDTEGKLVAPDRRVLDVNISASSDTIKLAIHYLRKNPNGGSIIVTASIAGYGGTPGAPHYTASKHGMTLKPLNQASQLTTCSTCGSRSFS